MGTSVSGGIYLGVICSISVIRNFVYAYGMGKHITSVSSSDFRGFPLARFRCDPRNIQNIKPMMINITAKMSVLLTNCLNVHPCDPVVSAFNKLVVYVSMLGPSTV